MEPAPVCVGEMRSVADEGPVMLAEVGPDRADKDAHPATGYAPERYGKAACICRMITVTTRRRASGCVRHHLGGLKLLQLLELLLNLRH
jgi:hypothetical protein